MKNWKIWAILGGITLLAWIGCFALEMLSISGSFRQIHPHFTGSCRQVPGVVGAEDMVFDPQAGVVYITSDDRRATKAGPPVPGAIVAYGLEGHVRPVKLPMDLEGPFHPHGLGLYRQDAQTRLFVVNHPTFDTSTVEIFVVEAGPRLRHLRTVSGPEVISVNDVAPVGPERFYVTNDAGTKPTDTLRSAETFLRLPWASVVYFDGHAFTEVASGLRYANGVTLSPDGVRVYVAETTGRLLRVYHRDSLDGSLNELARYLIPTGLDNISVDREGTLWIAAHPQMLAFLEHAADPANHSPSQILRVEIDDRGAIEVDEIMMSDGSDLSGSSVALPVGDRLLVGSVFEPHILDCRMLPSNAR